MFNCVRFAVGLGVLCFLLSNGQNTDTADEAAQNRWILQLRHKRLIFSNEMNTAVKLNGNLIKKISSGGDDMVGRNHGDAEEEFVPHFLAVCMANDINRITPYDAAVSDRVRVIPYNKKFVDEPKTEFELKNDPNLKNEVDTLRFQRVFVGLLIRRYMRFMENGGVEPVPASMLVAKADWMGEESEVSIMGQFEQDFVITNNDIDYVTSEKMEAWVNAGGLGISMKCLGIELKKHCKLKQYDNVVNRAKKINGKSKVVWVGISEIIEEGDEFAQSKGCDTTGWAPDLESEYELVET